MSVALNVKQVKISYYKQYMATQYCTEHGLKWIPLLMVHVKKLTWILHSVNHVLLQDVIIVSKGYRVQVFFLLDIHVDEGK